MVQIIANNQTIEKEIHSLLDTLIDAGSGFHSQLLIHEEEGNLSVKTQSPMEKRKEIIRLPRTVLMPGDQYHIDIKGSDFSITYPKNSIANDLQRRIIDKMYEIYNLTNKVDLHEKFSFLLSLKDAPTLIDKLAEGRKIAEGPYKERADWVKNGMTEEQRKKVIIETYIKTRPLGYSDPVRESSVSMIMPVLDFMNHNWNGGVFAVGQGGMRKGDLSMSCSQPFEDSTECYANYGVMDAFDTLARYDFIDTSAPIVRSVALEIEAPSGDTIKINNRFDYTIRHEIPKEIMDLRRHIPLIDFNNEGQLEMSHALLPIKESPFALFRVLMLALHKYNKKHNKTMSPDEISTWVAKAQEDILEANKRYYKELDNVIAALPDETQNSFGVQRIKELSKHQKEKLDQYIVQTHSTPSSANAA